jgi:hypothetical protein
MRPLAQGLERCASLVAGFPQHVHPHTLHERLAHGDVVDGQVRNDLLRLGLHAESSQGVLDGPAAIWTMFWLLVHRVSQLIRG